MKPAARITATIEILTEIKEHPRPADSVTSYYFRKRRYIGSKDRAEISRLLYNYLRHYARLGWWLQKLKAEDTIRNRFITYLRLVEKMTPEELHGHFDGERYTPEPLSADETKLSKRLKGHTLFHPEMSEEILGECPAWAYEGLKRRFGDDLSEELEALLTPAPLDLRINPLKITRDDALAELKKAGFQVSKTAYSPLGLRIEKRPSLSNIKLLKEGAIDIQDEGSQLVALLVEPKAGERVMDFCAGAGGKTLAISALMQNKGRIVACDVLEKRLKRSSERFRKAGLHNIEIKPLKSERDPWVKRHKGKFDRVLVDAPCSGAGTWRRNPDGRWQNLGPGLDNLIPLQASILESACRLVKDGGRLVYATCSMLPEENEDQIQKFLDNHPEFLRVSVQDCKKDIPDLPDTGEMLSLTPSRHNTDGFFAAVLEKRMSPS